MEQTIRQQMEGMINEFCDHFCKYPEMEIPEGKDEDWLWADPDSPCNKCPFIRW